MKLTDSTPHLHTPHLYFQLGELISSTGAELFAEDMYQLLDGLVPVHRLSLSEWTLDERLGIAKQIKRLGSAGLNADFPPAPTLQYRDDHPLLATMLDMDAPLLIQLKVPYRHLHPRHSAHQCSLVSRNGNRRSVISVYRPFTERAFTLAELSLLKSLSDTLLPLVEHHAHLYRQEAARTPGPAEPACEHGPLQHAFNQRLARGDISLSAREQEVCLGLLTGGTVPQMAAKLQVKSSSVETYLKRAATKLGVSGRHGLAKWMAGA